jgi:hypothetical protein
MRFDLESACRDARERMAVPAVPLVAIRAAAERRPVSRPQRRRKGLIAAVLAGVSVVAVAAAAEVLSGTHVSFIPTGIVQVSSDDRISFKKNPTAEELRSFARQAGFPVVLPAGLPEGTRLHTLVRSGPGVILLQYDLPGASHRSDHVLTVMLVDPKTISAAPKGARRGYVLQLGDSRGRGAVRWMVGREEVIVLPSTMTPAELGRLKRAMLAQAGRPDTNPVDDDSV